jgi:hypothetical protein
MASPESSHTIEATPPDAAVTEAEVDAAAPDTVSINRLLHSTSHYFTLLDCSFFCCNTVLPKDYLV